MPKMDEDFDGDFWLHVATDALWRYAAAEGAVVVTPDGDGITVKLVGVEIEDERVHGKFAQLVGSTAFWGADDFPQ